MQKNTTIFKGDWKVAILFSVFLPLFNIIVQSQHRLNVSWEKVLSNGMMTFCFLMIGWYLNAWLIRIFERKLKSNFRRLLVVLVCNAILLMLFILLAIDLIHEIDNPLVDPRNQYNLWLVALKATVSIGLIYLVQYAISSNRRAQQMILQNEQLKTENLRSQFEILRQQVNPHFLFNSLSTLRSMIRSNDAKAEEFVLKLSEIYRQLLVKREKDTVTLKEELDFVRDYSFMLLSRFRDHLKIAIDIPEELESHRLPTFSLQFLLENCIKHNMISSDKPLVIKIFASPPGYVSVENRIQPKITREENSGYGLPNLIERYKLLGVPDALFVYQDEEIFRVRLNLLEP